MDKFTKNEVCRIPTADELRARLASENTEARSVIASLFDRDTFVETGAYVTRGFSDFVSTKDAQELEGVITGYGAIDGSLAFVFCEDASRAGGVIDERHAKKIQDLYALAMKNGAPVIGIFNSCGTGIFHGTAGLAAYGRIIACVTKASGVIPQIAYVNGKCLGLLSAIASAFDFTVKASGAELYVNSPALTGEEDAQDAIIAFEGDNAQCLGYIRALVSFLPDSCSTGVIVENSNDNLNRMIGEVDFEGNSLSMISTIADNGVFYEVCKTLAPSVTCAFASLGGVRCGIVANSFAVNEGRIDAAAARKISRFVDFCSAFALPVVTLADSLGLAVEPINEISYFAPELARLAASYTLCESAKVTVITGHAIGASFVLLGSKALGADIVLATDNSEVCALNAESGVAFAWDKYITLETTRDELVDEWRASVSSPARAAASGEIDDIISVNELRARICTSLQMLTSKGTTFPTGIKVYPL